MSRPAHGGRHRLGRPGLRHCREMPEVAATLTAWRGHPAARTRHASAAAGWRIRSSLAVGAGVAVAVVSGWFTAGQALAEQIGGH